jgi:dihydrofolate synthase/folylpolyglutamate synthase
MYALGRFGIVLGLSTIEGILDRLGNPHRDFRCIHVAGTNGKGSVASSLSHILNRAGYRTGLYTSPHLVSFNERISIDNVNVTDDEVVESYKAVEAANTGERSATFFELTTAMAFYLFSKKKVAFAVVETGMGGRLDATNIIDPVLSIITNISLEHKSYLGSTLAAIAFEKAGIIKPGVPVISAATQKPVIDVIRRTADEKAAPFHLYRHDFRTRRTREPGRFTYYGIDHQWPDMKTNLLGRHQIDNAALALAGAEILMDQTPGLDETAIREGLTATRWAGRLEIVSERPLTIVDGAHNLMSIHTLAAYLKETFSGRTITLVTGILDDKAYSAMFKSLLPLCRRVILTRAKTERSIDPQRLFIAAQAFCADARVIEDIPEAITCAESLSGPDDVICISGSLYVVGEAKAFFNTRT